MATWRITWTLSSGRSFTRDIEATAKHTQDGYVSFVRWPGPGTSAGPTIIWQRPADQIISIEQIDNPLPAGRRRPGESTREWLDRANRRSAEIGAALEELDHAAGIGRPLAPGQPYPLITNEMAELGDLENEAAAELLAAEEAVAAER